MPQKNVAAYLDGGSIRLFAQQIVETLGNVIAVAVHDPAGRLIWAGPETNDRNCWSVNPFLSERRPGTGFCEQLSNKNFVYVCYLRAPEDNDSNATLSIQVSPFDQPRFEDVHSKIEPILSCIERQIAINAELSSVRRMTAEGRKGLQLLVRIDELDECAGPDEILRSIMEFSATHYNAELSAIVLPNLGIQETHPASFLEEESTSKAIMATLGALLSGAKMHRQVLLSDANIKTKIVAGLDSSHPKILCSPIINAKDDVIGIFVLMGPDRFTKDQVRLARAICAKINVLTRTADQLSGQHYSRHGLLKHVASILQRHPEGTHALLYFDIDKLHVINDKFGHMAGDSVIQVVGRVIDELAGSDDAVSHLNGDRFGFFLRDSDEQKAIDKGNLILDTLSRECVEFDEHSVQISASIGVALMPDVVSDASAALNTAEVAARSAKERGGGRLVVFKDIDASVAQRRSDLDQVNYLQSALIRNRFVLFAQPIQSLKEPESSLRYEILVRMLDEDGQILAPAKFMSAAHRYRMMSAIDRWVIKNTLNMLGSSENSLEINLANFSINLSAQSLGDDDFLEYLETQITESGVSPDSLCFEITETTVVKNLERAQRFIRRLRKLGCRLALDDFGTGYCSFAYLKDLPVQYIKLDGVFVRDILENPLSEAIVASMTSIAKVMHALTIAEHVENDLIMQRIRQYGIDYAQGFAIGKPRPLTDVLREVCPPILVEQSAVLEVEHS